MSTILTVQDSYCYLCGAAEETLNHIFIHCPFSITLWLQSPWQLRIEDIQPHHISSWIIDLCSNSPNGAIPVDVRQEVLKYAAVGMENTWRIRNTIKRGEVAPPWDQLFDDIGRLVVTYWQASR